MMGGDAVERGMVIRGAMRDGKDAERRLG